MYDEASSELFADLHGELIMRLSNCPGVRGKMCVIKKGGAMEKKSD